MRSPARRWHGNAPEQPPRQRVASACSSSSATRSVRSRFERRPDTNHGDGPCRGRDVRPRTGRSPLWRAARPRHGARSFAPRLGPADVLPLRRPHRRGHTPAGQADGLRRRTTSRPAARACAGASPTSTPPNARLVQARRRYLGNPHRPQAGDTGDDGAQRHVRCPDPAGAAVCGAVIFPLPLWERVDRMSVSSFETGEGSVSADRDPSSAFASAKAPSPTRGEGEERYRLVLNHSVRATADIMCLPGRLIWPKAKTRSEMAARP